MKPPKHIADLEKQRARDLPEDKLELLRNHAATHRDRMAEKKDLEARLKEVGAAIHELEFKTLPDLMDELGIPRVDLEAKGNLPAIKIEAKPYYRANIAADWPDDKRRAAFAWLAEHGSDDLIKTSVIVAFPRESRAKAIEFAEQLIRKGLFPEVKEAVPWGTLTAWLKEQIEKHNITPPLETFGATVGRRAHIKEQ